MEKFSNVFTRDYSGIEYEVVVEDDIITTGKVFSGGKCILVVDDLSTDDGSEIPYTYGNLNKTFAYLRGVVSPSIA